MPDASEVTTGPTFVDCDPSMSIFLGDPRVASVEFDFDAMTCSVVSETGSAPQIVFDVQTTGLIVANADGMEIQSTSYGQLFGGNQIIDLITDFPVTVEASMGGSMVVFEFNISSGGPTLAMVAAQFL